jgi:predicted deacylase
MIATLLVLLSAADLRVGPITAREGEMASGTIELGEATIPITVVHGARPGPVLGLVAGNHGYEYTPILALQKLRAQLDAKKLAGSVIMVHAANMPSFLGRTIYFSPIDQKNLNRVYPGKRDGTISERIAYAITTEVIEKSDYLLDLHCGDGNEDLRPYVYKQETGDAKMDARISELVTAFGFEHAVIDRERPKDRNASVYCSNTAVTRGKPAMTVESGYLGVSDPKSIAAIVDGVQNVMRYLKISEGPVRRPAKITYYDPSEVLTSPATGILYWHVARDQRVRKDDLLAHVTDFFGKKLADVRSPFDGVVLYIVATPPITKDQPVAFVGRARGSN